MDNFVVVFIRQILRLNKGSPYVYSNIFFVKLFYLAYILKRCFAYVQFTSCVYWGDHLERDRTSNKLTQKARNSWKDTVLALPSPNKIENYVTKSSPSDVGTWNHLERDGTSKELTQNTRNSYDAWRIMCMQYH